MITLNPFTDHRCIIHNHYTHGSQIHEIAFENTLRKMLTLAIVFQVKLTPELVCIQMVNQARSHSTNGSKETEQFHSAIGSPVSQAIAIKNGVLRSERVILGSGITKNAMQDALYFAKYHYE